MPEGIVSVWKKAVGLFPPSPLPAVRYRRLRRRASRRCRVVAPFQQAPGNIAVTVDGRIIVSQHQFYDPVYHVVEGMADGTTRPFPNEAWAMRRDRMAGGMVAVLGLRRRSGGRPLDADNGSKPPWLIGWDLAQDDIAKIIAIPPPAAVKPRSSTTSPSIRRMAPSTSPTSGRGRGAAPSSSSISIRAGGAARPGRSSG